MTTNSGNIQTEPKFVVFLSQLQLLFKACPECKTTGPAVETSTVGTMIKVQTKCFNPHCPKPQNTWNSQPQMTETKMPAANFLLCFSILVSGASPSKVLLVFKNMGLACISLTTCNKHQAVSAEKLSIHFLSHFAGWNLHDSMIWQM